MLAKNQLEKSFRASPLIILPRSPRTRPNAWKRNWYQWIARFGNWIGFTIFFLRVADCLPTR